jgi:hypothetical protein
VHINRIRCSIITKDQADEEWIREEEGLEKVCKDLIILKEGKPGERLLPWKASLDDSMFYV